MKSLLNSDELVIYVLTENTAQDVFKYLNELESSRSSMCMRWGWELLQNARDTLANADTRLIASVEYGQEGLVFRHNGPKFTKYEMAHLIYKGSTKVGADESLGKFGSGFLTTHLLSSEIAVSGQLDDGQWFDFCLTREPVSVEALGKSMKESWDNFNLSLASVKAPMSDKFTTQFRYPIENDATDAVEDGILSLKQCAPLVVIFNPKFFRIDIKSLGKTTNFKVIKRVPLQQEGLQEVTVAEIKNGTQKDRKYLLVEGTRASVAVPIKTTNDSQVRLVLNKIPKLFLGFPLVSTEDFSFSAVINSFRFAPTENRDSVFLGEGNNEANVENQAAIEEACQLLISLLKFAASSGWRNICVLADIPPVNEQNQNKKEWLQKCLDGRLIERIRQTPVVINEAGDPIAPEAATLPLAKTDTDVEVLWNLLDGVEEIRDTLPRRNEAVGWWRAVKSWAGVYEDKPISLFNEAMDGLKLAVSIDGKTHTNERYGTIKDLQGLLQENIDAVEWLDQLHDFFKKNELREAVREYHIVLAQDGVLDKLSNLHRDQGIAEELKDIAELLDWKIRRNLRDIRLSSLTDKVGKGDRGGEYVVQELIRKLQERAEDDPDDDFAEASVRLFAWIVGHEDWNLLRDFPAFAEETDSDSRRTIIKLERTEEEEERPLSPIPSWSKDLQAYSELFPRRFIIASASWQK